MLLKAKAIFMLILDTMKPILFFFRYHGNRSPSGLNFNDTVKLPDLENPQCGARLLAVSAILAELNQFFVLKFPFFVTVATRVHLG